MNPDPHTATPLPTALQGPSLGQDGEGRSPLPEALEIQTSVARVSRAGEAERGLRPGNSTTPSCPWFACRGTALAEGFGHWGKDT